MPQDVRRRACCVAAYEIQGVSLTSSSISLALSLLFGVAQLGIGGAFVWHLLRRDRWRPLRGYFLLMIAAWFVCSGIAELIVSGMETTHRLWGAPAAASFAVWRGRVDVALAIASALLLVCLFAYPLMRRLPASGDGGEKVDSDDVV